MFTGLIEMLGTVVSVEPRGAAALLGIKPDTGEFSVLPGASVAVDGACLTLEKSSGPVLFFTAVAETLERTTLGRVRAGVRVNMERALMAGGRFDGHMVLWTRRRGGHHCGRTVFRRRGGKELRGRRP